MARWWVGNGLTHNFNATGNTNWASTDGGANNATVPDITQDVTFNGNGATANTTSICSATISFLSLTITSGYTSSITMNAVLTIGGSFTDNTAHTWAGASGITISAASTIASGGKTFPNAVIFSGANTKTLNGDWTISGALTISGTTTLTSGTGNLSCAGISTTSAISGTSTITLTGGTWTGNNTLSNNLTIAGNVTIGNSTYTTGTLTYSSGTVSITGGTTLTIFGSCTLNTNGITFINLSTNSTATITINSLLSATGTWTWGSSSLITFAGTAGFNIGTLTITRTVAGTTYTLVHAVTYTVTTAINIASSGLGIGNITIASDDGTTQAKLTLNQGATCNVLASFTRIDASGGRTIFTFNGTLTTTTNITAITDLSFVTGSSKVIQGFSNF